MATIVPQAEPSDHHPRRCAVDGCDLPHDSKGYCKQHARRLRVYGDPLGRHVRPTGCSVPGCDRGYKSRGYCELHYGRWKVHGTPELPERLSAAARLGDVRDLLAAARDADVRARFWAKVDKSGDCWEWTGANSRNGYGCFAITKKWRVQASRFAYVLQHGRDPGELFVCHACDNPPCVRGDHLWLGTPADNMRDASHKGRVRNHVGVGFQPKCPRPEVA